MKKEEEDKIVDAFAKGYSNLVDFRKVFLTKDDTYEVESPNFHYVWSNILLNGKDNYAIEGFRQSGKTSVVLMAFPQYCLRFPDASRNYIVIIKANATQAEKQLRSIQAEFFENKLLSLGAKKPIECSSQCLLVDVLDPRTKQYKRVRIEAYGRGGAVRGLNSREGRPKIVIIDDPQDIADMKSETILEDDWNWYDSDIKYLGKETRVFFIGNNLGKKCLIERVIDNAKNLGYKTMRIPICTKDMEKAHWPALFPIEFIKEEMENNKKSHTLHNWFRERMCEAVSDDIRIFKSEYFQYYPIVNRSNLASSLNIFIRVDPAVGQKESNDPTAILVAGFNKDSHLFLLDGAFGRWTTKEKLDQLFRLVSRWQPINVGVENSKEGKLFIEAMRSEKPKRNIFFKDVEVTHGGRAKETRIMMLQPRFEERTVWFPDRREPWLDELENQLLGFTSEGSKTLHDDLIDTLAYFEQQAYKPSGFDATRNNPRNLPRSSTTFTRVI